MKIWSKGFDNAPEIDAFTVGKDRELDLMLAPWDILGTMAHITMLSEVGLLGKDELAKLLPELKKLHQEAVEGRFTIEGEDVHSEVEARLTAALGDIGKKVHTGRSRNDQVAVDIKLYTRARLQKTVEKVTALFNLLQEKSEALKDVLMPGYTHLQVAMPSSFGLWLGAYAESLTDDLVLLKAAWDVMDENPLGSAAGYGSSAPLNRFRTTELLGFGTLDFNSIYAQMSRGRGERMVVNLAVQEAGLRQRQERQLDGGGKASRIGHFRRTGDAVALEFRKTIHIAVGLVPEILGEVHDLQPFRAGMLLPERAALPVRGAQEKDVDTAEVHDVREYEVRIPDKTGMMVRHGLPYLALRMGRPGHGVLELVQAVTGSTGAGVKPAPTAHTGVCP